MSDFRAVVYLRVAGWNGLRFTSAPVDHGQARELLSVMTEPKSLPARDAIIAIGGHIEERVDGIGWVVAESE